MSFIVDAANTQPSSVARLLQRPTRKHETELRITVRHLMMTSQTDRQRIDAALRRAARSDLWTLAGTPDALTFEDHCNSADDELFTKIRTFSNHILHALLPPPSTASENYSLRQRAHSLQLPERSTHLSHCNFLTRMLYKNSRPSHVSILYFSCADVLGIAIVFSSLTLHCTFLCRCAFCHALLQ